MMFLRVEHISIANCSGEDSSISSSLFFSGDITEGQLVGLKTDIESNLESDDSIIVFSTEVADSVEQTVYGSAEEPGSRFT